MKSNKMKEKIIETSFFLFLKYGFTSVSIQNIAKAVDISVGTFYYYFKSKDDVVHAVMEKYIFQLFKQIKKYGEEFEGTSNEKLRFIVLIFGFKSELNKQFDFYQNLTAEEHKRFQLLLLEGVQKYEIMREKYYEFTLDFKNHIMNIILEAQKNNEIRTDLDVYEITGLIQSAIIGTLQLWVSLPNFDLNYNLNKNIDHIYLYVEKKNFTPK